MRPSTLPANFSAAGWWFGPRLPTRTPTTRSRTVGSPPIPISRSSVLVNRGSASASEVLSAALQERQRAVIIGENTFGKNTVQQRFGLSNGGALKLTVARWVTADGADFGGDGVTPDINAELDTGLTVSEVVAEVSALAGWPAS